MSNFDKRCVSQYVVEFSPSYYKRYVEDRVLLFDDAIKVNYFLQYLDSEHQNIFLRLKIGKQYSSFLDAKVSPDNYAVFTSID